MVWKCDQCEKDQHKRCTSRISCDCECNLNGFYDGVQKVIAVDGGIALAVGGLALTICTGGLVGILFGGAMLGAGISSTWNGGSSLIKNERINGKSYATDVAFGAVTGVATGGVGAAGETVVVNIGKDVVMAGAKTLAVRTATGVATGVTSKVIDEVKQCSTTDKKWSDYGKSYDKDGNEKGTTAAWVTSGVVGGFGGVGSHISSSLSQQATSGAVKSATRIATSGITAGVSDATIQGVNIAAGNQDEYNVKRTFTSATTSAIMTAAQEGTKNAIYHAQGGKNSMLNDRANKQIIKEKVPEQDKKAALEGYDNLKKVPQSKLNDEILKSFKVTNEQNQHALDLAHHQSTLQNYDKQINDEIIYKKAAIDAKDYSAVRQHQQNMDTLIEQKSNAKESFQSRPQPYSRSNIQLMNSDNAHFLTGDKTGQVSIDINPPTNGPRGSTRVTFDYDFDDRGRRMFRYADYNNEHDYAAMANYGDGHQRFSQAHSHQDNMSRSTNEVTNNLMRHEALKLRRRKERRN